MEEKKKTNVVAIIGFIISIISVLTFGLLSFPGLILSIIGLVICKKYKNGYKGLSIAGIIISGIFFIVFWALAIYGMNIPVENNQQSTNTKPVENLKDVRVTDFTVMTKEEIDKWCEERNLNCLYYPEYSDEVPVDGIISQSVAADSIVKEKTKITITYSLGHQKTPEEIAEEEKNTFKASCQGYSYEEISRNPDNYKGLPAVFTGEVAQVMESSYSSTITLRVNVTQGEYGWWDDTIYVTYTMPEGRGRILEKDIVTIYGTLDGLESYTAVLGNTITIPRVKAKYIE